MCYFIVHFGNSGMSSPVLSHKYFHILFAKVFSKVNILFIKTKHSIHTLQCEYKKFSSKCKINFDTFN